ncbi:MAG: hypothetical protein ACJAT1_001798 [Marivirga sp.]|jgi:hypothetical protein
MNSQELSAKLSKYEYKHKQYTHSLSINLGLSQEVSVTFTKEDTIKIKDTLTAWNPLTGIINLSVKGSIIFNTISLILIISIFAFFEMLNPSNVYLMIILGLISWLSLWTTYYHIKSENFKRLLIDWLEE